MSNLYDRKFEKHTSFLEKILVESGKSDNPNIIDMINELSNSVIKDIDNLKSIIKKPGEFIKKQKNMPNKNDNGSVSNNFEENGEQKIEIKEISKKGMRRNLSDYVKIYKPAQKVKKINDNSKEIEIYFSEKSENEIDNENGKAFQDQELESNIKNQLKEFERNSSKTKIQSMMISSFHIQLLSYYTKSEKINTTIEICSPNSNIVDINDEKDQLNYSQNSVIQYNLNGNSYDEEFIKKLQKENYYYKHELSNLKNKIIQFKLENEIIKGKLKKYLQHSEFLEKKLENIKISNGSNSYLFSNNINCSTSTLKPQIDFERMYMEKCEEFENFEYNFKNISEKFSNVLEKIKQNQFNIIEDNKRLKEFLFFILQCFNHKQFEHISYIINYAKDNPTFIDKQIFQTPGDSFKLIERNYNGNVSKIEENSQINQYLKSEESQNEINNIKNDKEKVISLDIKYEDLKFSKTIRTKLGNNSNSISKSKISSNLMNSNHSQTLLREKEKDTPYRNLTKINREKSSIKDPLYSNLTNNNLINSKLISSSEANFSKNLSLMLMKKSKDSINMDSSLKNNRNNNEKNTIKENKNVNFNLNNSYFNKNLLNNQGNQFAIDNNNLNNIQNCNGNTTIDLNLNLSGHIKQNDSIISDSFNYDFNQSNLRDLVNISNSTNINSLNKNVENENLVCKTVNKLFIGKSKYEISYSDLNSKNEQSPIIVKRTTNFNGISNHRKGSNIFKN